MKWNKYISSIVFLLLAVPAFAESGDSTDVQKSQYEAQYEKRMQRRQNAWMSLIPTHFVIQNAGNMGLLSAGIGWSYGKKRKWETELLFGFIPKHDSSRPKFTTTFKGNFIPWRIDLTKMSKKIPEQRWLFEPLTTSLYLNTVYGHEFWKSQPGRYPDGYYEFMSTKFRLNVGFGERLTFKLPEKSRFITKRVTLFYEISTCDLYIRSFLQGNGVKFTDIFGCSIGAKFYTW